MLNCLLFLRQYPQHALCILENRSKKHQIRYFIFDSFRARVKPSVVSSSVPFGVIDPATKSFEMGLIHYPFHHNVFAIM